MSAVRRSFDWSLRLQWSTAAASPGQMLSSMNGSFGDVHLVMMRFQTTRSEIAAATGQERSPTGPDVRLASQHWITIELSCGDEQCLPSHLKE